MKDDLVVVTGAAGLLGRHVVAALDAAGHRVRGVDLPGRGADHSADLCDAIQAAAALAGARTVIHAAAIPRPIGTARQVVFQTNMQTTFNVLEVAEAQGTAHVVLASSFSVLGLPFAPRPVTMRSFPVTEDHPTAPQDVYAVTKWLSEEMVDAWTRRTGGAAVSLRMPWLQSAETFHPEVTVRRDTPEARLDLWAYLDLRDAGRAAVMAVQALATGRIAGHERLFLSAADTYSATPTMDLIARHYPDVPVSQSLQGHRALLSGVRAAEVIGFAPLYGWRDFTIPPS
jgi:nucleoside-diphosphate-sugar epimerase